MKKIFTKLIGVTLGLAMAVGVGVGVAANNRAATGLSAGEEVYKSITFLASNTEDSVNSYTDPATYTANGFSVATSNFNNYAKAWDYIKCGRKNNASVATITTSAAIDVAVTKVAVTIDSILDTSKVNSIKLYSSTNGSSWALESSFTVATGAQAATISSPTANKYYKAEFDCASYTKNGIVQVSKIDYYYQNSGPSLSVSPTSAKIAKNGTQLLTATANGGSGSVSWTTSDSDVVSISAETGTSITATGEGRGTATITASYSTAADVHISIQVVDIQHTGTKASPYTVEEAKDKIDLGSDLSDKYVTGIVSEIVTPYNSEYGNISYNISSDGSTESEQFQAYRGKSFNGEAFTSEDDIEVGATVVVHGNLTKYNSTYEFAQDNQLVTYTPAPRYTVTFDSLGGSEVSPIGNVKKGTCIETLPTTTKVKDTVNQKKFEFAGWYTVDDPNNIVFEEGNRFTSSTPVNGNITVYAKYNETNYYIVTFNTNGGNSIASQEVDEGDTVLMPANPSKPADASYTYTFEGWYTNQDLTDEFDDSDPVTSNLNLYAKYTSEAITNPGSYLTHATSVATIHGTEHLANEVTVTKTSAELATANGWTASAGSSIGTVFDNFNLDSNITVSFSGIGNTASYWSNGSDIRVYGTKNESDASITFTGGAGVTINSITLTFSTSKNPTFTPSITSDTALSVNASSQTITMNSSNDGNGQIKITAISVDYTEGSCSVDGVVLRFGASIAKSDWDAINNNIEHPDWEITDYGVMFLKEETLNGYGVSSVKAAFESNPSKPVTIKHKGSGDAPYLDGDNYLFTIKVSIPAGYYGDVICAAPFIVVNDTYYFLGEEKHESVNSLATYYRANGGSNLSNDALDYLKTAH